MVITLAALIMAHGFYLRYKRDGVPVNYRLLAVVSGAGLAMWTGAAVTEYVYNPDTISAGFVAFFVTIWLSAGIAWQVTAFIKKLETPRVI